ncbi:MAG: COX15/CtaA family protein [Sphingopyxis sp.]
MQSLPPSSPTPQPRPLAIMRWLLLVALCVAVMVVVGGITRLTESGLSITQWNPVSGAIPPLSAADWAREFALYQRTTEFQTLNRSMDLAAFKHIYFWEWLHRLLGRLVGLVYAVPLVWFAWKRAIPTGFAPRLIGLLVLGALQGVVGWWMVVSGLVGRTDVSHYRLAVHLNLALFILGLCVWSARDMALFMRHERKSDMLLAARGEQGTRTRIAWPVATWGVALALLILAAQLLWGAFTAGLNAGYAYASWPLMGDAIFPTDVTMTPPWAANLIDNPIVVQFIHRWLAFVAGAGLLWLAWRAWHSGDLRIAVVLAALVVVQITLGIATLLSGVALPIAVAHQGVAALLVACAAWCGHAASGQGARR